ncbi:hypothetical protein [Natrinema soli]|uniref:Uncharacterized protein n=1 Tax=Natrinema soli TaxID=1930624 RepID=A0ABD5SLP2_9EURY|nr:hypothetical protein [Natrinema soli]
MPDLQLYTLIVASASQSELGNRQRQQLAQSGILNQDGGVAEQLSSNPADQTLDGVYRGRYAEKMATEIEELSSASGFEAVPLAGVDGATPADGYYVVEEEDIGPAEAQTGKAQRYELSLSKKGTRNDNWRALETTPGQLDRDAWGADLTAHVGVPSAASKVQWFNADGDGTRVPASLVETRSAELGDIDIYDLEDAPWYAPPPFKEEPPTLLYEIPYTAEENVDVRVYDTLGQASKKDGNGDLQWQKLFSTQHDFDHELVIDTGLLRLRLDEAAGTIEAETWDSGTGAWTTVGLEADQPSTVTLFDIDLETVAMARVRAQLTFDIGGTLFALNAIVARGAEDVLFGLPENETGPVDADLENWLSPIASTSIVDPQAEKTLTARKEVRL